MRKQYHFRPSKNGLYAWDVHRLIELTSSLTPEQVKIDDIAEIDECYWFDGTSQPTGRAITEHFKLMMMTDPQFPIILCSKGRVMDGMHRILKALYDGKEDILAIRFIDDPMPDYVDIHPDELPYEETE